VLEHPPTSADAAQEAQTAFEETLHVGRPNVGSRDRFMELAGEIFDRGWFTNDGPLVREFEGRIAEYLGVRNCVAMCNGTIALEIAIRAVGMTGEVILPSYTFVATAHALHWQGITPVFADIDPATHTLDPDAVRNMITPRTTGIIGVHLWGRAAPVRELQKIADEHGLQLLFDAAHAFGCSFGGQMIGRFGRAEVLSFHATKFFNSFEGGAVVTDDDELAEAIRLMRNFGFSGYDNVIHPGTNGKMIEVCAAMGLVNLDYIDETTGANRRNQSTYQAALENVPGVRLMKFDDSDRHNFQYVVLTVEDNCPVTRDDLIEALHAQNVLARRYFWPGCHRMKPYRDLFPHAGLMLPQTERVAAKVVVLPNGSSVNEADIERVASVIAQRVQKG
jgi:dTDP-4-amino-4,6-dideoxygalactose transaminase